MAKKKITDYQLGTVDGLMTGWLDQGLKVFAVRHQDVIMIYTNRTSRKDMNLTTIAAHRELSSREDGHNTRKELKDENEVHKKECSWWVHQECDCEAGSSGL